MCDWRSTNAMDSKVGKKSCKSTTGRSRYMQPASHLDLAFWWHIHSPSTIHTTFDVYHYTSSSNPFCLSIRFFASGHRSTAFVTKSVILLRLASSCLSKSIASTAFSCIMSGQSATVLVMVSILFCSEEGSSVWRACAQDRMWGALFAEEARKSSLSFVSGMVGSL